MDNLFKMIDGNNDANLNKLIELKKMLKRFSFIISLFFNNFKIDITKEFNDSSSIDDIMKIVYVNTITKEKLVLYKVYEYINTTYFDNLTKFKDELQNYLNTLFETEKENETYKQNYFTDNKLDMVKMKGTGVTESYKKYTQRILINIKTAFDKFFDDKIIAFNREIDHYIKAINYINIYKYEEKTSKDILDIIVVNILTSLKLNDDSYKIYIYRPHGFAVPEFNKPYELTNLIKLIDAYKKHNNYRDINIPLRETDIQSGKINNYINDHDIRDFLYNLDDVFNYLNCLNILYRPTIYESSRESHIKLLKNHFNNYSNNDDIKYIYIWILFSELIIYFEEIINIFIKYYSSIESNKIIDYFSLNETNIRSLIVNKSNNLEKFIDLFIKPRIINIYNLFINKDNININDIKFFDHLEK
jgi:hypothetical protein